MAENIETAIEQKIKSPKAAPRISGFTLDTNIEDDQKVVVTRTGYLERVV